MGGTGGCVELVPMSPEDPISPLAEAAVSMHEIVLVYVQAGFSRAEAIQIVTTLMAAKIRGEQS
jgi:hypothetical protein